RMSRLGFGADAMTKLRLKTRSLIGFITSKDVLLPTKLNGNELAEQQRLEEKQRWFEMVKAEFHMDHLPYHQEPLARRRPIRS
ncbi:MAG: hypothetical protein ACM3JE_02985, partial [Betaproteobacteria bacterium]